MNKEISHLLLALLLSLSCVSAKAQISHPLCDSLHKHPGTFSADSSTYSVRIGNRTMEFPLAFKASWGRVYNAETTFVENGTTYLYREYSFNYTEQPGFSSYYIIPHKHAYHPDHLQKMFYRWEDSSEYFTEAVNQIYESGITLVHNDLGDMPRYWYPVKKYNGKYYLSVDNPYMTELRDSVEVYHGMELYISPIRNVSKTSQNYHYETLIWHENKWLWVRITLAPYPKDKRLWVRTEEGPDGTITRELMTPQKETRHFDLIEWESSDHIEVGLEKYDKIEF
jgi:hypothetical protein